MLCAKIRDEIKSYEMPQTEVSLLGRRFLGKYDATIKLRNEQQTYSIDNLS